MKKSVKLLSLETLAGKRRLPLYRMDGEVVQVGHGCVGEGKYVMVENVSCGKYGSPGMHNTLTVEGKVVDGPFLNDLPRYLEEEP